MELTLSLLIEKLIVEIKRIKKDNPNINLQLEDDVKLIFFTEIEQGSNLVSGDFNAKLKSFGDLQLYRKFESLKLVDRSPDDAQQLPAREIPDGQPCQERQPGNRKGQDHFSKTRRVLQEVRIRNRCVVGLHWKDQVQLRVYPAVSPQSRSPFWAIFCASSTHTSPPE